MEWYEEQKRGLSFDFIYCLEVAIKGIQKSIDMYPNYTFKISSCTVSAKSIFGVLTKSILLAGWKIDAMVANNHQPNAFNS